MTDDRTYSERWREIPAITTVAEYDGQESIRISATQLGSEYTARAAVKFVDEWLEFFQAGPSPIRELEFVSRTPRRLFNSLNLQSQLVRLQVKWGDFNDLAALAGMSQLRELVLGGASSVESVEPLRYLPNIETLRIESLKRASDLSPIGDMTSILDLELGGDWISPRIAHIDSIAFMDVGDGRKVSHCDG
ncbi:hypothetical protein [Arthrobacter sp. HY1533]|uniref:hypothetical protein n=1 Tax=Arthrobacter sp. HY1533 TaxID=2970919 RepID=UPI0022B9D966|nr:hypothetical protein [Arthrobacter sp. HY1533]